MKSYFCLYSQWRLVHKGSTPFGPRIWLNVQVDKPTPTFLPAAAPYVPQIPTFTPITIANFPPPPPPPDSAKDEVKLTNENLLKSIGFIPAQPSQEPADLIDIDSEDPLIASSTEKLLQTFEVVANTADWTPVGVAEDVEDDYVVIVPDCFDLTKPLSDFSLPTSLSYVEDSYDLSPLPSSSELPDPTTTSCDSHVSILMAPLATQTSHTELASAQNDEDCEVTVSTKLISPDDEIEDGFEPVYFSKEPIAHSHIPPPTGFVQIPASSEPVDPPTTDEEADGDSPPIAHRSAILPPRLTLRNLKGGLYRNPLAIATGLVNAVSEFVDDKVHFAPTAVVGGEKKPCVQFADCSDESSSSDDEEEDFHVRNVDTIKDLGTVL